MAADKTFLVMLYEFDNAERQRGIFREEQRECLAADIVLASSPRKAVDEYCASVRAEDAARGPFDNSLDWASWIVVYAKTSPSTFEQVATYKHTPQVQWKSNPVRRRNPSRDAEQAEWERLQREQHEHDSWAAWIPSPAAKAHHHKAAAEAARQQAELRFPGSTQRRKK